MEKRSTPSLQITDRFGAQTAFASLRLPDGTEEIGRASCRERV